LKEGRELLSNFANREVSIHEKKDPHRWITRSFESLDLTHVDFGKLETGRKEGETVFRNPEMRIVDSQGIDQDRRTWKAVDLWSEATGVREFGPREKGGELVLKVRKG
jgi:hypothetical protein